MYKVKPTAITKSIYKKIKAKYYKLKKMES